MPYFRVKSQEAIALYPGGMGLGLAITDNVLKLIGGSISVQSDLGKGSCFQIKLLAQL